MLIYHKYSEPLRMGSEGYLSFWLYGAHTNASIAIVFHTNPWKDCFVTSIIDDFSGWKHFSIPKSKTSVYKGSPSWDNITKIEILLGNIHGPNEVILYLGDIEAIGYAAGITYYLPATSSMDESANLLVNVCFLNQTSQGIVELRSDNGTLLYWNLLDNGTNVIKFSPKHLLDENNKLTIYVNTLTEGELIEIRFIAITK